MYTPPTVIQYATLYKGDLIVIFDLKSAERHANYWVIKIIHACMDDLAHNQNFVVA